MKLTKEQRKEIENNKNGSATRLCEKFGICRRQVYYIWRQAERRKLMRRGTHDKDVGVTHVVTLTLSPKAITYLNKFPNKSMAIRSILERLADIDAAK